MTEKREDGRATIMLPRKALLLEVWRHAHYSRRTEERKEASSSTSSKRHEHLKKAKIDIIHATSYNS